LRAHPHLRLCFVAKLREDTFLPHSARRQTGILTHPDHCGISFVAVLHADEELERLSHSNRKRIAVLPSSANISKKDTQYLERDVQYLGGKRAYARRP
jgi:hypothetical protein